MVSRTSHIYPVGQMLKSKAGLVWIFSMTFSISRALVATPIATARSGVGRSPAWCGRNSRSARAAGRTRLGRHVQHRFVFGNVKGEARSGAGKKGARLSRLARLEGNSGFQGKNERARIDLGFDLRFPPGGFDFFEASYDWLLSLGKFFLPRGDFFLPPEKMSQLVEKLFLAWRRSKASPKKLFEGPA